MKFKDEFRLEKIKVFSSGGEIIFSTEQKDIGGMNTKDYFHLYVAQGNSYTRVVQKDTRSLEDQLMKVDVVETYVPIMSGKKFIGAFEIYFDITKRNQELSRIVFRSSSMTFAMMFGFFVLIVMLISKPARDASGAGMVRMPLSYRSAVYMLFVMVISIFIAEIIVMCFVSEFHHLSKISGAIIDSVILVMMVSPVLYYSLFRPLMLNIERRKQIEEELKKAQEILVESNNELTNEIAVRMGAEELIMKSQQEWEDTFNFITDMITIHDRDFNIIKANRAAKKILGLPVLELAKSKCYRFYHGSDRPPHGCPSCDCLDTGRPAVFEVFEPHLSRHIEIRAIPRFDGNGRISGLIHIVRDITRRKKMENRLKEMLLKDDLTGLYNRRGFFTMLDQRLKAVSRQHGKAFLLYADLDNFKEINDEYGHQEGDRVLIEAAGILRSTYRETDLIARLGGDEFVVFPAGDDESQVNILIARLYKNIDAFNSRNTRSYRLSISVGAASYDPACLNSVDGVLAEADKLMYKQKHRKYRAGDRAVRS